MSNIFSCNSKFLVGDKALERMAYELYYYNSSRVLIVLDQSSYKRGFSKLFRRVVADSQLNISEVVIGAELPSLELADTVVKAYYATESNAIVVIGGHTATDVCKIARLAVSQGLDNAMELRTFKQGVDNIPLVMIQSGTGCKNVATSTVVYYNSLGMPKIVVEDDFMANAVVIDDRMAYGNHDDIYINGMYIIASSLAATLDADNEFRKSFYITSLRLAAAGLMNKMPLKDKKISLLAAISYSGVGHCDDESGIISQLAYIMSKMFKVNYKVAFYIVAPHAMQMFMNTNVDIYDEFLAVIIGNDAMVTVPREQRSARLMEEIYKIYNHFRDEKGAIIKLSDLKISPEQLDDIYEYGVNLGYFNNDLHYKRSILELLNRAL